VVHRHAGLGEKLGFVVVPSLDGPHVGVALHAELAAVIMIVSSTIHRRGRDWTDETKRPASLSQFAQGS
jgi:hypothetical protein